MTIEEIQEAIGELDASLIVANIEDAETCETTEDVVANLIEAKNNIELLHTEINALLKKLQK